MSHKSGGKSGDLRGRQADDASGRGCAGPRSSARFRPRRPRRCRCPRPGAASWRARSCRARDPAAGRCLRHGRLCRARRRCGRGRQPAPSSAAAPAGHPFEGAVGPGRRCASSPAASVPAGCRCHPAAGGCRGARRPRSGSTRRSPPAATSAARGLDFAAGEAVLARRPPADRPRHRAGRRGQPSLAGGAPRARASASWRPATRSPCPATRSRRRHRQLQRPCAGRPGARRRRRPAGAADRPGRHARPSPRPPPPPAPATCW